MTRFKLPIDDLQIAVFCDAAYYGVIDSVRLFLETHGAAAIDLPNSTSDRPAGMIARTVSRTALTWATDGYRRDCIMLLLEKGASVNASSSDQVTPLHLAVGFCPEEIIELYLSKGANIDAQDWRGDTPLHTILQKVSIDEREKGIITLLINAGADPDIANKQGLTARQIAVNWGVGDMIDDTKTSRQLKQVRQAASKLRINPRRKHVA